MKRANCCSQTLYLSLHSDVIGHLPPVVSLFLRSDFLLLNVAPFLLLVQVYGTIYLLTLGLPPHRVCVHLRNEYKCTLFRRYSPLPFNYSAGILPSVVLEVHVAVCCCLNFNVTGWADETMVGHACTDPLPTWPVHIIIFNHHNMVETRKKLKSDSLIWPWPIDLLCWGVHDGVLIAEIPVQ